MPNPELIQDQQNLFEKLCDPRYLRMGFKMVKKNKGAPGIDGISIALFEAHLFEEIGQLEKELQSWTYKPKPVRRVDIPKPGKQGEFRMLGIPCVRDRVVQATLKLLLEPILDPLFSPNSYGFRPGRNQEQAILSAQEIVAKGKGFCVDIDLAKFFDRVPQDRLVARLSHSIHDKRILRVIGLTLRGGIMENGIVSPTDEGTVQGSPLSPLLSNVVLDELDKELERRGLEFCRFADDCNIFVASRAAANRAMDNVTRFIEGKLKLKVNRDKSQVAPTEKVKFLGMTIVKGKIAIAAKSLKRAMDKTKELIPRRTHRPLADTITKINLWYVGWSNYFKMTQYPAQLKSIEAHIRRRLRAQIVANKKRKRYLVKDLLSKGVPPKMAYGGVYKNRKVWALSHTMAVERAYSNKWFAEKGLKIASDKKLSHWLDTKIWIKVM